MELNQGASYGVVILCEYMHIDRMKVKNKEIVIDKNVRSDTDLQNMRRLDWLWVNINNATHGGNSDLEDKPKLLLQGGMIRLRAGESEESIVSPEKGSISGLGINGVSLDQKCVEATKVLLTNPSYSCKEG